MLRLLIAIAAALAPPTAFLATQRRPAARAHPLLCDPPSTDPPPSPQLDTEYFNGFLSSPLAENRGDGTEQALKLAGVTLSVVAALLLAFLASNGLLLNAVPPASASNLPPSTGASSNQRATVAALSPILQIDDALSSAYKALPDLRACVSALEAVPREERSFKRAFDEYSEGVSFKQLYRNQNAFLVYYTQGFDGPGRPSIEEDSSKEMQQRAQYGLRNDAWLALADARDEATYLLTKAKATTDVDGEVRRALERARVAFDQYLALVPAEQLAEARQALARS
jgi:hypothetical protein